jgi:general secretion pathway protein C
VPMQEYLKSYYWVVNVAVVMLCAYFSATALNHYLAAEYLGEAAQPPKPTWRAPRKPGPSTAQRNKSGDALAQRNMFCSKCMPVDPAENETGPEDGSVPLTSLPLRLVATNMTSEEKHSFATIRNTSSGRQGAYWLHDVIPEAGEIESIRPKYVDFRSEKTKRLERLALLTNEKPKPASKKSKPSRKGHARSKRAELMAEISEGIKKVDDTHYEVDRSLVGKVMANPMLAARGARIVPSIKNGKANGFKLYAIRPNSVYAKLGLRNGDTIHAVNGFELTTPDKALEVYTKVKEASSISVTATRRGKSVTLNYNIQ